MTITIYDYAQEALDLSKLVYDDPVNHGGSVPYGFTRITDENGNIIESPTNDHGYYGEAYTDGNSNMILLSSI